MNTLTFTLLSDGSSDRVLLRHLNWLLTSYVRPDVSLREQWADLRGLNSKRQTLSERIETALDLFPCDVLFVHRDAERVPCQQRRSEIDQAIVSLGTSPGARIVPTIPVRMLEAWLLCDESAIRAGAGNPNGTDALNLPTIGNLEDLPDPKSLLFKSLKVASGLRGRRLKKFRVRQAALRVGDYIDDFSPLRQVPSFMRLESEVAEAVRVLGLD